MVKLSARWHKVLEAEVLQRSSQTVAVVGKNAYVFGGELRPREPRDNAVYKVSLDNNTTTSINLSTSQSPSPRVGAAWTTLNGKLYLFSGRGGVAMAPIEELGSIWEFDPTAASWSLISPSSHTGSGVYPAARSYHCMASDGENVLYLHAGCPEKGRLSDLWAFSLSEKTWTELTPAPDPPRGGTSIAFAGGMLYRMNGFDGKTEQGGSLDIYSPETNAWISQMYLPDGTSGPTPRSVSALVPILIKNKMRLITLFGERDPSSLGHQGAGKMLSDVWSFDIGSKTWQEVDIQGDLLPAARGWFDADVFGKKTVVVQGGLGESNERLSDVWTLHFD
ncbi:hypothetical protein TRVA0_064S00474 [Trichomonascus vanleenenianus]|uniref:uncharacterized protein n=1 Tax=Trichomonascus vanleenenianus TaxID=2268995 RepID=UPI003EC9F960